MTDYAVPRPDYTPGESMAAWFTRQLQANPSYRLPAGWKNKNGRAVRDTHSFLDDLIMYGAPAAGFGIAGGMGIASALHGAGAAAMPAATAGIPAGSTFGSAASSAVPSFFESVTVPATTKAAGGLMTAKGGLDLAAQLLPLLAMRGGGNSGQIPMQDELTQLLSMQRQRIQQTDPLYQAVLKMAMGLLPVSARSGMQMPGMTAPRPVGSGQTPMARRGY